MFALSNHYFLDKVLESFSLKLDWTDACLCSVSLVDTVSASEKPAANDVTGIVHPKSPDINILKDF